VKFEAVADRLEELSYPALTSVEEARPLYDFVLEHDVADILELGFAHGTSTCYMAAGLDARGTGHITTIDRTAALDREPNIHTLLDHVGLTEYVEPIVTPTSYTWELMKIIQARTSGTRSEPGFDFCFIDGAHAWETDGFAFFLVDKLLRPGGTILFDDVHWTYASSAGLADSPKVREMPEEERTTPQVLKIIGLLVLQHPEYEVRLDGNYAWAQKREQAS
jgi:predicted O-methyltransferase YrrM